MTNRRNFLLGAAALGFTSGGVTGSAFAQSASVPLGLQMYTVRDDLAKDFDGTTKKGEPLAFVSGIGTPLITMFTV